MRRLARRYLFACAAAGLAFASSCAPASATGTCWAGLVTGYLRYAGGTHTADGTPVAEAHRVAAVDYRSWVPFGTELDVEGLGAWTVRDTGYLAAYGVELDVMVETAEEAAQITGERRICLVRP